MNKFSKYFFVLIVLSLVCVMGYRYYEYIYLRNFLLDVNAPCNPTTEQCFVADCELGPDCDDTPYKKVEILAHDAPQCLEEHSCETFSCDGISTCIATYCSSETLTGGEKCLEILAIPEASTTPQQ
jgi:hypothetical protein